MRYGYFLKLKISSDESFSLTFQRREPSIQNQLQITKLTLRQRDCRQGLGLLLKLGTTWCISDDEILQNAACRRCKLRDNQETILKLRNNSIEKEDKRRIEQDYTTMPLRSRFFLSFSYCTGVWIKESDYRQDQAAERETKPHIFARASTRAREKEWTRKAEAEAERKATHIVNTPTTKNEELRASLTR